MPDSFQDVVSGRGRSIRSIPVSRKGKHKSSDHSSPMGSSMGSNSRYSKRSSSKFGIWFIAIVCVIVLFLITSLLFSGVKVKVFPKQEGVLVEGVFSAFREAQSGELSFEIMTLEREAFGEVASQGEEFVEEKASGKIIIYNNYSSAGQKLIKDTRFETPDGLIYRIKDAVTVPGRTTQGGETVPGSIEVTVYADKPGEAYNIDLSDFTIPGLKGDPRYSKFYGRSKTPMEGGLSGTIKKASDEELARIESELEGQLLAETLKEASEVLPEGFVLLPGSYVLDMSTKTSNGSNDNVLVTMSAEFVGLIFNEDDLAKFVAENTIALYDGAPVELSGTEELTLTIDEDDTASLKSAESVGFRLSGTAKVVWVFEEESLVEDLKGQSKKDIDAIMSRYPSIDRAEVVVRPFWKRSVTDNVEKIKVERIIE